MGRAATTSWARQRTQANLPSGATVPVAHEIANAPAPGTGTAAQLTGYVERLASYWTSAARFFCLGPLARGSWEIGIRDVAFSKAKWASVSDMVKDSWT